MRKITLLTFILVFSCSFMNAQKKKDLLFEIRQLKIELDTTKTNLATSQRNEKISASKVVAIQEQLNDLKTTNASLLSSLSSFTEASKKKSDNIGKTLESLREKENQLKVINDALTAGDSTKLAVFSTFKNAIGDAAKITITNGVISIAIPNTLLFGDNDKNYTVDEKAKGLLEKIATTLNENPGIKITVEGNSNALEFKDEKLLDNWDLSARQAASIVRAFQNDYMVDPKRMDALGKSQYGGTDDFSIETSTRIIINPEFDAFYALIREHMKN
ncbi:OmpA family protein [Flavobacteriaceae bacterium R38]|nr:OmpA family protein [Flavobacteriaceae bacterium R38]